MHKGFKCLDVKTGRIYISRDVVFDESIYPFASLHSNAGARLQSEIIQLPFSLLNPSSWGRTVADHVPNDSSERTNELHEPCSENQGEECSPDTLNNNAAGDDITGSGSATDPHEASEEQGARSSLGLVE